MFGLVWKTNAHRMVFAKILTKHSLRFLRRRSFEEWFVGGNFSHILKQIEQNPATWRTPLQHPQVWPCV